MAISAQSLAQFVRWRLVPVRYAGRLPRLRLHHLTSAPPPRTPSAIEVDKQGWAAGPTTDPALVAELQTLFASRAPSEKPPGLKAPFVNLSRAEDFTPENPLMRFAFSPKVFDVALDYFGGQMRLDSLQVLYSFATEDLLKESQKWHLDYGDSKSFHCVMYLNDVQEPGDGPFVFVNKADTKRIRRSMIIRRIEDDQFSTELGEGKIREFYGSAGESVMVDPAVCYHFGSRCSNARTAVFVTFNSDKPFVSPAPLVRQNIEPIRAAAKKLRPDLGDVLDRVIRA